jgi:DNA-binding NtrC family response regulator
VEWGLAAPGDGADPAAWRQRARGRDRAVEHRGAPSVKQQLESLVSEMIEKGILFDDACREFEKKFISRVLQRHKGNLSRAAKDLRIHRNTLGKKIVEYKLSV